MAKSNAKSATLPSGYEPIRGDFGTSWDFKRDPVIEGLVVQIKELKRGGKIKKDTRVLDLQLDDGRVISVWQSAAIKAAFDTAEQLGAGKCRAAFVYRGAKKIPGMRNPMHDIVAGVKAIDRKSK